MAVIQNDRDVLLQAAAVRVVPVPIDPSLIPGLAETIAATKGIKLSAPSNVFQFSSGGAASPSSITVTATLTLVASPVTWDIFAGTATLTGSGNARTLTAANMVSNSVTIRARAQEPGGPIYTDYWTIAKTADGANGANGTNGTPGANGERGSITAFGTLSNLVSYPGRAGGRARWAAGSATEGNAGVADTAARNVIWQRLGNSGSAPSNAHMRLGDTVTLTNSGQTVSATGYWTGAAWDTPGTVIDGNLLVGGNVSGQEFTGGSFIGSTFRTSETGNRAQLSATGTYAHSLVFYNGIGGSYRAKIDSDGSIEAVTGDFQTIGGVCVRGVTAGDGTGVLGQCNSTGTGTWGESNGGNGIVGQANGAGAGGRFKSTSGPAVQLVTVSALPSSKAAGGLIYHTTHGLCYADGTNWKQITGTTVP